MWQTLCSVQFLKPAVVSVLFLLIVADRTQWHFWQFFPGCKEGLLFFVLIRSMCSMFSWCFSLQKLPFPRNCQQIRNNFWRSPVLCKTDIVFISIHRCCLVLCKAEMKQKESRTQLRIVKVRMAPINSSRQSFFFLTPMLEYIIPNLNKM